MPAWATIVLTLGSTAIGAVAALAASWRARGAAVLGPLRGVLDDLEPKAIAASGGRSEQTIANIGRRWWRARDELLVFGAAHPSTDVAGTANLLAHAGAATWTSVTRLNVDAVSTERLQAAVRDHDSARELADRLGELMQA
jgi:hypothetical protein